MHGLSGQTLRPPVNGGSEATTGMPILICTSIFVYGYVFFDQFITLVDRPIVNYHRANLELVVRR
ncbi:PREDICTED: uncharacterized protein LOC105568140 isoform X2 [Vollenhovia emeryi]|uniref:uncharacterized protein LOC105568140 isoform X2 n=1 Tax=Vollenhovia emeryi TaxID=411798 RepID=UPI0005F53530|nr:PREDICTED: uncharacterized protein LOC105568140 isoform X2 [Vollenhovia emeryi]